MTEEQERLLKHFETRVRQTMLLCESLKKENASLKEALAEKEEAYRQTHDDLVALTKRYERLNLAHAFAADGDIEQARKRISSLVREINACIALIDG